MKRLLLQNIGLKLTAVFLAGVLWFVVTSRGQTEISFDAPLEFRNIPQKLGIVSSSAKTVNITVRGHDRLMKGLRRADVRVSIDLSRAKKGESSHLITPGEISVPHPLVVSGITPSSVKVRLDEMLARTVRVQPVLNSGADGASSVLSVAAEPATVTVRGFRSEIRKLVTLKTEPIDINGMADEGTFETGFDLEGMNISPEPETVKVKITVRRRKG
ncbi:MAG: CdaR family protein [Thermodesulfovibrionales bacterium]